MRAERWKLERHPRAPWFARLRRARTLIAILGALACSDGGGTSGVSIASIRIDPGDVTINVGETMIFVATPLSANGDVVVINAQATWESLSPSILTIDESGLATAVSSGTATIEATIAGKKGQAHITVQRLPVFRIAIDPGTSSLARGQTATLTAHVFAENGLELTGRVVTWTSLNASVGTVSTTGTTATLTAVAPGNATIRASSEGVDGEGQVVVTPDPIIALSSSSANFAAVRLGSDPSPQGITITNSGGGALSGLTASVQPAGSFLTVSLSGTTAPATLTLNAALGSLAAGTHSATVTVSTSLPAVASRTVTVTFTVAPGPTIALGSATVAFVGVVNGANPPSQTVAVSNSGGGTLTGLSLGTPQYGQAQGGWLAAAILGTSAPPGFTITLNVSIAGLPVGLYTATVAVNSSQAGVTPATLNVTLAVGNGAVIALSPSSRTFNATTGGTSPPSQTVNVTNGGIGSLTGLSLGTITYSAGASGWLTASISGPDAPAVVTLTAAVGALSPATYTATVPVQTSLVGVPPASISVTFVVGAKPTILVSATSVTMNAPNGGGNPTQVTLSISSGNGAPLTGLSLGTPTYGGSASGWLVPNLLSTSAPANLVLNASVGGIPSGTYTASLPVQSANASNSPVAITVTLVVPPPRIAVSTLTPSPFVATQSVGAAPSQGIGVSNGGGGQLTGLSASIQYLSGNNWLSASLNTTTAPATLTLSLTGVAATMSRGTYSATVRVASPVATNSPVAITVTLVLQYTFTTHVFGILQTINGSNPGCFGSGTGNTCHNSGQTPDFRGTLNTAYNTLRFGIASNSQPLTVPFNVSASWVYQKVSGNAGTVMPTTGFSFLVFDRISGWILDGAVK